MKLNRTSVKTLRIYAVEDGVIPPSLGESFAPAIVAYVQSASCVALTTMPPTAATNEEAITFKLKR